MAKHRPQAVVRIDPSQSKPLSKFHYFNKFPTELRIKIWRQAALSDIRVITLALRNYERFCPYGKIYRSLLRASKFSTIPPSILHTCREAREVGLKFYTLSNEAPLWPSGLLQLQYIHHYGVELRRIELFVQPSLC